LNKQKRKTITCISHLLFTIIFDNDIMLPMNNIYLNLKKTQQLINS